MFFVINIVFFGFIYALKGGSISMPPWWKKLNTEKFLNCRILSTTLVFFYCLFVLTPEASGFNQKFGVPECIVNYTSSFIIALAWILSIAPSIGEEHGAVGDYKEWWGPYKLRQFGRMYGIKKAVQRGAWMGLVFMLLTPYDMVGLTSLLFVPAVFVGQSLNRIVLGERGWTLAEPIVGGLCIGLGVVLS